MDGPGGLAATDDHTIAIARDSDGTTVTITVVGAEDDAAEFEQVMDLGDGTTMHVRDNTVEPDEDSDVVPDTVEEVMIVTTDIDAPTPTPFADVDDQELDARDLDDTMDGDDMDGNNTNDFTALNVVTANAAQVMSAAFTSGTGGGALSSSLSTTPTPRTWTRLSKPQAPTTARWERTGAMAAPPARSRSTRWACGHRHWR